MRRRSAVALGLAMAAAACSPTPPPVEDPVGFDEPAVTTPTAAVSPAPDPSPSASPTASPSPSPSPSPARNAASVDPYAVVLTWGGIEIRLPSAGTEMVGLHQSNHDGARPLATAANATVPVVLDPGPPQQQLRQRRLLSCRTTTRGRPVWVGLRCDAVVVS